MAAPPRAPLSIAALPTDLISAALAFLSVRPRLRIASLVCRRWRSAALRSVTSVACFTLCDINRTVALFPALQDLCLVNNAPDGTVGDPVVVPTTCTSLRTAEVLHYGWWPLPQGLVAFAAPAVPLQLRHLTLTYVTLYESAAALFTTSLTSLTLKSCVHFSAEMGVRLAALHLPCLTDLSVHRRHTAVPPCLFSLMANHASQLKSLTLGRFSEKFPPALLAHPMPALTRLSVRTTLFGDVLSRLLRECTNLTSVEYSVAQAFICDIVKPLSLLASLTSFSASHLLDERSMEALAKCRLHAPRLTRVQMPALQDVATVLQHDIGELLTKVTIYPKMSHMKQVSLRDVCDLLYATPNLEKLSLPGVGGDANCRLTRPLLRLTELMVEWADLSAAEFYAWLSHVVSYCPDLHSLTFSVIPIRSPGDCDQPIAFIRHLIHSASISHLHILSQTHPYNLPLPADFALPLCEFVAGCEWFGYLHCEHLEARRHLRRLQ